MTIMDVSKLLHKDPAWVRAGIIEGWLPFGVATRRGVQITSISEMDSSKGRINYYIYEAKFWRWLNGEG